MNARRVLSSAFQERRISVERFQEHLVRARLYRSYPGTRRKAFAGGSKQLLVPLQRIQHIDLHAIALTALICIFHAPGRSVRRRPPRRST
jgi:hypothetical protein